jgi:hypothetical protein
MTRWPWPLTLKINRVPDSLKDWVCTKFGQHPLKAVDSRVFTRMLRKEGRTLKIKQNAPYFIKNLKIFNDRIFRYSRILRRIYTFHIQCIGRTDGSVTISHRNFVGEGIIICHWISLKLARFIAFVADFKEFNLKI